MTFNISIGFDSYHAIRFLDATFEGLPGFFQGFQHVCPQPPRETDVLLSSQAVYAVGGERADRLHPEGGGK